MSWTRFFRRSRWDAERSRELESYLEIEIDDNLARGLSPDAARQAALRKLGNRTRIREDIYRINTAAVLETLARDLRYSLRMLRRNPTFAVVSLLTLGLGIGGTTAVFTVVNGVLIKPLPYPNADELIAVWNKAPGAPGIADVSGDLRLSPSMFFTYKDENRTFRNIGIWFAGTAAVTGVAEPEQVRLVAVSHGTLEALDVRPTRGRWLSEAEQTPGSASVMIGYGYWQRRFGGDQSIIGRTLTLDARPREIVGVMPSGFRIVTADPDVIVPLGFDRGRLILPPFGFQSVARLKPGTAIDQASADIARMLPIWNRSWPAFPGVDKRVYESWRITPALRPLKQDVVGNVANVLWVVMGTIAIVMLIACANVANLLLVRADARQQELTVRAALGAGSWRIVRELMLDSLGVVGLYGVIAYAVSQRRREIGIRLALGAQRGALRRRFVRHGVILACVGVVIGAVAAITLTRLMSSLLFGVSPNDPVTYVAVAVLLMLAAALASYVPARRASSVPLSEALAVE
jgi:hypothetical protein